MCGIAGIIDKAPVGEKLLDRMARAIAHRGPDGEGRFVDANFGMCATRLAVIDPAGGAQPFRSDDGRFALCYNGETYNHLELKRELEADGRLFKTKCDTEAVLRVLECDPVGGASRLKGIFAFALWDTLEKTLYLGRDRLGVKPLYYYFHGGVFAFASEIKSLLEIPEVERNLKPDPHALREILRYNFPVGIKTAFEGINELQPGHVLVWREGRIRMRQYWDLRLPRSGEEDLIDEKETAEELIELLRSAVKKRLMSDVPLGTFLSGGPDSSIVTALARAFYGKGLKTFAMTFEEKLWDESEHARAASKILDTDHHEIPIKPSLDLLPRVLWHLEQPQRWAGTTGFYRLYAAAKKDVTVVLTGEGADEIFAGYPHLAEFDLAMRNDPRRNPIELYFALLAGMTDPDLDRLISPEFHREGECGHRHSLGAGGETILELRNVMGLDPLNMALRLDIKFRLVKFVTFMLDRLSMAHGVEAREPFLDHELVEFAMRIHPSLKIRPPHSKYILRRAARAVLPDEIADRPKQGFVEPIDSWMRSPLPACIERALSPKVAREKGYFVPGVVEDLMKRHLSGAENRGGDLVGIASTHIWDDLFMVGKSVEEIEAGE